MRNYKIVASDLDGTLLNSKSNISSENLFAINELFKRGVYFVPSTGRTFSEIPAVLKDNSDIRYIIYSNGAVVFDKFTGKRILNCISNSDGKNILDILNSCESHITFRCNGESFVDNRFQGENHFDYYNVCDAHRGVVRDYAVHLDDFKKASYSADNIEVFGVSFHSYDDKMACKKNLEKNKSLSVVEMEKYGLEIFNVNAGKGNALHSLADMLGVSYSETISLGDSDNDSSIIQAAGLGLAVGNACDSLKEVADDVICTNEEHAVDYVLSHYFA